MKTAGPEERYARVWVDLGAYGWAGGDDPCYYVYSEEDLARCHPRSGRVVCIYMEIDEESVVGCLARLERYANVWRFRAMDNTWFLVKNDAFLSVKAPLKKSVTS